MDRSHHLNFCKKCKNRSFDLKKGILCSLTNDYANFFNDCPSFIEDTDAAAKLELEEKLKIEREQSEESLGLSSFGIKNGITAGMVLIAFGFCWILFGIMYLDRIFFFPFVLIILGIIVWAKGHKKANLNKNPSIKDDSVLDRDFGK